MPYVQRFYPLLLERTRKWFRNRINPFNMCPSSLIFWLMIPPYSAIGFKFLGLRHIGIFWRQQIDPNDTLYLMFKMFELKPPFPLMLLVMFSCFGLVITDGANTLVKSFITEIEEKFKKNTLDSNDEAELNKELENASTEKKHSSWLSQMDPFKLTPRMSIYFPIHDDHVSIGFLTIDFRHIEISIKQSLDPNDTILSLIRFIDLYSPFPLQIAVMTLSVGLFTTGTIYDYFQESREEVVQEVKRSLKP